MSGGLDKKKPLLEWKLVSTKVNDESVELVSKVEIPIRDFMFIIGLSRKTRKEINRDIREGVERTWNLKKQGDFDAE